ncbi:DNA polymerase III subunit gamma/tau [Deinococcus arcticus]|uniref:DNA polymerase III subunit gamma/tau n=1 Tax=Deinococcus arcticus TaxID=2136176 RepID=A0A2T3W7Q1_9DEIO|nr:DNA polymerase III subunit gamma/tau [Deinococcus arcticus]PTA67941.1 DNA polymerase III, subunit gamma and tau [Deinococcus arcticus]
MSAIYQRARPVRWEDVVGQEHVKDVLRAALSQGRVGHAYLFSGPRGVGKTTTARLIAMTANCTGPLPKPCGECDSCLAVRAGSHPDVLEIDAASNNSVDDVRDLREKVGLAAMRGGKKIYILDEAHMMSRAAFNALLKTLEEPPGHVIFILATTEPEKIIPTILSRCQHYRFRRLTPEEIAGKLTGLAAREGVSAEPAALALIGRLADGAMRDGESLLERMLAAGNAITRTGVEEALGLPPGERVRAVAAALVSGDAGAALQGAGALYRDGFAARTVVEGLVSALGAALHAELGLGGERLEGADVPRLLRLQAALDEQEARFARAADGQSLELALTHALLAADGSQGAGLGNAGGAAVPAELTQRLNRLEKELASLKAAGGRSGAPLAEPPPRAAAPAGPAPVRAAVQAAAEEAGVPLPAPQGNWADVLRQASMQLKAYLKPARMHAEAGYVSLSYDEKNKFHAKQLAGKFDEVGALVLRVFGPVTFELVAPEGGRRVKLGGNPDGGAAPPAPPSPAPPSPAPHSPAASAPVNRPPAQSPPAPAAPEIAPFEPGRGTPPRRAARGPEVEPLEQNAPAASAPRATPQPASTSPRPAGVATLPPPLPERPLPARAPAERRVPPASPDDVAPAPLPVADIPWDDHAAQPPRPPADAQGGDRVPPPTAREPYIVEAITEEPDWDAFGAPVTETGPPLEDAPFAEYSVPRPPPRPAPAPAAVPTTAAAPPGRPGDIRAHPMYEDIRARFSGRVREIGKNRNTPAAAATEDGGDEE